MITRRPLIAGLSAAALLGAAVSALGAETAGVWTGALEIPGGGRLRLRLQLNGDGTGVAFSVDQGNASIPVKIVSFSATSVVIEAPAVGGRFAGRMSGPDRIEGTWSQGGDLPLVLVRGEAGLGPAPTPPPAPAPTPPAPLDDQVLAGIRAGTGSPAMAAAAQRRGGPLRLWATGERRIGTGQAVTVQDRWHLGSITKSMTSTLLARSIEAGDLSWDTTLGEALGAAAPDMRAEFKAVTLRHLASHHAGLTPDILPADMLKFSRAELPDARAERLAYARIALAMPQVGPAGTTYQYANNGYVVIGAVLEQKYRRPWEMLIRERLFAPLRLASAGFGPPDAGGAAQPCGHMAGPDGRPMAAPASSGPADNPVALGPAGRVHMALADLMTYVEAHRDQHQLLKPESWKTLHTPPFGGPYAMGWVVRPDGSVWHNGSNTLWYAAISFDPVKGVATAVATNDGRIQIVGPVVGQVGADAVLAVSA